jgi:hypothetical protein
LGTPSPTSHSLFKIKIRLFAVFLPGQTKLMALYHRTDAFRAQGFLNLFTVLNHSDLLQVGFERPPGSSQRKTAVVTKAGSFPTGIALRHCLSSFPYIYYKIG